MLFGDEHVRVYEETDGAEGHIWLNGAPVLILTTTGRKSSQQRKTPLIYQQVDGGYVVVASAGGADQHPDWFLNLQADPEVRVQVGADKFPARSRVADPQERAAWWPAMARVWPDYDKYQTQTEREIPLVLLEPAIMS